jgi:hypothetical protein
MSNYFAQTEALMHKSQQKKYRLNLTSKDLMRESEVLLPLKFLQVISHEYDLIEK